MTTPPSDAHSHADLLGQIQDELDRNIHKKKESELRIQDMRKAFKAARKSVHKQRLHAIHAAEKDLHAAKTEAQMKSAKARLTRAREVYHSGLKKIHAQYKPGGGTYSY